MFLFLLLMDQYLLGLQGQRLKGNCTMFKVLLVVPRFLFLDLKFFLHNHVCQHLSGLQGVTQREDPPVTLHDKVRNVKTGLTVQCAPAAGTGLCAPHHRTDSSPLMKLRCVSTSFPIQIFKIKAMLLSGQQEIATEDNSVINYDE